MTPDVFPRFGLPHMLSRMWDERISRVRAFADAITERDVETALELCHPEVEFFSLLGAARGEALPRIRRHWESEDEKLWRATMFRDPADALRAAGIER